MTDLDLGIIYSIKHLNEGETCKERIKNFLYKYTDTPKEYPYSDTELYRILVETVKSYMEAAESPRLDMYNFFDCLRVTNPLIGNPEEQRIVREYVMNAMIGMLGMARVKRDGEYVNGFREMRKEYK
jgi:hypothetical protein